MMKAMFLTLLLWACCQVGFAQEGKEGIRFLEDGEWTEVLRMAREQHRPVFMDCYTSWCGPCRNLARTVFSRKDVGDFFNSRFINVKYDMEKGKGIALKEKYADYIIGYPTLLMIDGEGRVVHRMAGFHEAEELISGMEKALEGKTLAVYEARYAAGEREFAFIREYAGLLEDAFLKEKKEAVLHEYMKGMSLERLEEKEVWNLLSPVIRDPYSPEFEYVVFHLDHFHQRLGVDRYRLERNLGWQIERAVNRLVGVKEDSTGRNAVMDADPEKMAAIRRLLDRAAFKHAGEYRARLRIAELAKAGEWPAVFNCLEVSRDMGVLGYNPGLFLDNILKYAVVHCPDRELLQQGAGWLEQLQGKEDVRRKGLSYHSTLARLYERLGDRRKAESYRKLDQEVRLRNMNEFKKYMEEKR